MKLSNVKHHESCICAWVFKDVYVDTGGYRKKVLSVCMCYIAYISTHINNVFPYIHNGSVNLQHDHILLARSTLNWEIYNADLSIVSLAHHHGRHAIYRTVLGIILTGCSRLCLHCIFKVGLRYFSKYSD